MKLADLVRPGVLRAIATATPATTATQTAIKAGSTVAKVATVAVATIASNETVAALILAHACKLTGHQPEQLPEQLRADLLARDDASTDYMAHVIREDAEWYGWDGRAVALGDYAPGGRYCREDQ